MAEAFGEWRRRGSPCGGALVLWLADLLPGAGWGLLDHRGRPKLAYHHLRRALAPVAVWSTDEGLSGVVAHVANDRPEPLEARLRVALYRSSGLRVDEARVDISLKPHSGCEHNVERLVGRFVDVSWSYRFGPPAQDLIVLSLERTGEAVGRPLSQAIRHPAGRPSATEPATALGLCAAVDREPAGGWSLRLQARRLVYGCRVTVPGFVPEDDGFSLEPGYTRYVRLIALDPRAEPAGALTATNLEGQVRLAPETGA
jgi:beta-mannosidase